MKIRISSILLLVGLSVSSVGIAWGETFKIDPGHSSVLYRTKHSGVSNSWGRFNEIAGTVSLDEQNATSNSIDVTINAASIDSGNAKRDEHLRSPDFFNAKQFPTITFKSEQVKPLDAKTYEVTGTLTLHGVSKPLTFKLEKLGSGRGQGGATLVGLESTFQIKRSEFGMTGMLTGVGDDVQLIVSVEAGRR